MTDLLSGGGSQDLGHWVTVAKLAQIKGISRQSASEKVARLEREGRLQTRRDGRNRLVELATYDRIVGQVGDAAREIGAESKRVVDVPPLAESAGLRDAQAQRAQYEAKLKALDYAERTGQLLPIRGDHGIETALLKVSDQIVRDLNAPMTWIDDLMEAARQGEPALRRVLRTKITAMKKKIADHLLVIAGEAAQAEADGSVQVDIHFEEDE
ncbi:DNA-binding transcriptional ArsR family regulator [Agrobacterium vitis]|nr:DNA-binding transcriptional ArsR family regulator [Agrobacterium vitis]MBE1437066.1 DNA-binding transcriptional ArsR family regulator [Agrobacterium vitis]